MGTDAKPGAGQARREFWTLYMYGGHETICSKHRTVLAAGRALVACERRGGASHRLVEVVEVMSRAKESR